MLRRLTRGKEPAEPPAVAARWREILRQQPDLAAGIELYRAVQRLQRETDLRAEPPRPAPHVARDRLAAGVPLLHGAAPFFDVEAAVALFGGLCRRAVRGPAADDAAAIIRACERSEVELPRAIRSACALEEPAIIDVLASLGERAALTVTLLRFALGPAFRAAADAYAELLVDAPWDRGVCPVCGAPPLLAELRGGESRRLLRCGRCGAAWSFQRLRCPFCDNRDHRQLIALHLPGEGDFLRLDACDACGGYLKALARLDPVPHELLSAEDLATAHLDLLALERGYRQPG